MYRLAGCLEAFITAMSQYYKITKVMWQSHIPTSPFMKPHMEITPCHQATQYFNGLLDMREEAIWMENARRGEYTHDAIPRYKDEKFMNFGRGHGSKTTPQAVGSTTTTTVTTPEAVGGQFTDVEMTPTEGAAAAATSMPPLKDAEPLEGAVAPSPGIYNPAGNKYWHLQPSW